MVNISQLEILKSLLSITDNSQDAILTFYLDNAKDIICEIRNTSEVESKYTNVQIKMAVELYSKRGAEGQTAHSENGIDRTYETSDISPTLINQVIPFCKTPSSIRSNVI